MEGGTSRRPRSWAPNLPGCRTSPGCTAEAHITEKAIAPSRRPVADVVAQTRIRALENMPLASRHCTASRQQRWVRSGEREPTVYVLWRAAPPPDPGSPAP